MFSTASLCNWRSYCSSQQAFYLPRFS
jgi:hypothetical protein